MESKATFARARAAKLLKDAGVPIGRWLGITGGKHIIRAADGRVFSVDLVINQISVNVGLMPSQWEHPPRDEYGNPYRP